MILFEDDFQDNRNSWNLQDDENGNYSIENGALNISVTAAAATVWRRHFPADSGEPKRFTLKAIVRYEQATEDNSDYAADRGHPQCGPPTSQIKQRVANRSVDQQSL